MAYAPVSILDANSATKSMGAFQDASSVNYPAMSLDTTIPTYRVSANFTPTATGAVTVITVTGSASKTIRIRRIFMGGVSTAVSNSVWQLQRTSALGAGGTLVAPTVAKLDTSAASATAVVNHWTSTLKAAGVAVGGPLATRSIGTNVVTTPATAWIEPFAPMFPEVGAPVGQSIVLRGTAEILEVQNVTPANLGAGTVLSYLVEWTEDGS